MSHTVAASGSPSEPPRWVELLIQLIHMLMTAARDWPGPAYARLLLFVGVLALPTWGVVAMLIAMRG